MAGGPAFVSARASGSARRCSRSFSVRTGRLLAITPPRVAGAAPDAGPIPDPPQPARASTIGKGVTRHRPAPLARADRCSGTGRGLGHSRLGRVLVVEV